VYRFNCPLLSDFIATAVLPSTGQSVLHYYSYLYNLNFLYCALSCNTNAQILFFTGLGASGSSLPAATSPANTEAVPYESESTITIIIGVEIIIFYN
jgi:hypothetical protein